MKLVFRVYLFLLPTLIFNAQVTAQDYFIKAEGMVFMPFMKNSLSSLNYNSTFDFGISEYRLAGDEMESIAKGYSFGGVLGKSIDKELDIELGLNYTLYGFRTEQANWIATYTNWKVSNIHLEPTILYGFSGKRVSIKALAGGLLGISKIIIKDEPFTFDLVGVPGAETVTTPFLSYGFSYGTEVSYSFSQKLLVVLTCKIATEYYKPRKATYNYYGTTDIVYRNSFRQNSLGSGDNLSKTIKFTPLKLGLAFKYRFLGN